MGNSDSRGFPVESLTQTQKENATGSSDVSVDDDFETDWEDAEGGLANIRRCTKNPGHPNMTPVEDFTIDALPAHVRSRNLFGMILASLSYVVKIKVGHVSDQRPDKYHLARYRGRNVKTVGTGYAVIREEIKHQAAIDCPLADCPMGSEPHKVTPVFHVETARHVVYDNSEAKTATVEFFYDYDGAPVVTCHVVALSVAGFRREDRTILQCVSHDLDLFGKIDVEIKDRIAQVPTAIVEPQPAVHQEVQPPVVVVISHPHGCYKHVSIGEWMGFCLKKLSVQGVDVHLSEAPRPDLSKLRDYFADLQLKHPSWRETGISDDDIHISAEDCRRMERQFREGEDSRQMDHSLAYISYTTATCPGSSGAQVLVFFEDPDGGWQQGMWSAHFRGLRTGNGGGHVNASGTVAISPEFQDRAKQYMATLLEEKNINLN